MGYQGHELPDRDFMADSEIDRVRIVIELGGEDNPLGRIVDVEELAGGGAAAPNLDELVAMVTGIEALLDQRGDHVRTRLVEVVPRTV